MSEIYDKVYRCYEKIRAKTSFKPRVAVVLGSGLGAFAKRIKVETTVSYEAIDGFPTSTVQGHAGQFVFGYVGEVPVVIMEGRVHYYEGYEVSDVVLPIRLMCLLGAETLFLTNAAGGMNTDFNAGDLMMITDHVSSFVPSPLVGENINEWGTRFPPMDEVYSNELQELLRQTAKEHDITLKEGVYVQTTGPNYESPAEVRIYQLLGGDAVGMSTAVEAIAAKHMGMKICGISCVSNMACGISETPLSHEEVGATADRVAPLFQTLLEQAIQKM